jgi:hypothetical protein
MMQRATSFFETAAIQSETTNIQQLIIAAHHSVLTIEEGEAK